MLILTHAAPEHSPGGVSKSSSMKHRNSPISLIAALLALGLAACSSSPISRIDANRALYESWPLEMQSAVLDGKVVTSMTPEMVRMALGNPTRIDVRSGTNASDEVWVYEKSDGSSGLARPNVSLGGSIGGVGVSSGGRRMGGGGSQTRRSAQEQQVVFQNGVVKRVD